MLLESCIILLQVEAKINKQNWIQTQKEFHPLGVTRTNVLLPNLCGKTLAQVTQSNVQFSLVLGFFFGGGATGRGTQESGGRSLFGQLFWQGSRRAKSKVM